MKKLFSLIILCTLLLGCSVQSKESIVIDAIDKHSAGFIDGVECAEIAVEQGHPISYCYEVLEILNKKLKDKLL